MFYFRGTDGYDLPKDTMNEITRFQRKQKKGSIDVWWLYDDGGKLLCLLYFIILLINNLIYLIKALHYFYHIS
jgi:hypothetical protein